MSRDLHKRSGLAKPPWAELVLQGTRGGDHLYVASGTSPNPKSRSSPLHRHPCPASCPKSTAQKPSAHSHPPLPHGIQDETPAQSALSGALARPWGWAGGRAGSREPAFSYHHSY